MIEPAFDSSGYPTDETLEAIEKWSYSDFRGLMKFVVKAWHWPDMITMSSILDENGQHWQVSTGGWSGNESIIVALQANFMFWAMCWVSSRRGGHYEFEVKPIKGTT